MTRASPAGGPRQRTHPTLRVSPAAGLFILTLTPLLLGSAEVGFPGSMKEASAPDGSGRRIFYREHIGPDGGQASPVFYDDAHGHVIRVATVSRNMQVRWAPDSKRLYIEDNWGSDIADCYVMEPHGATISGVSLVKLTAHGATHPRGAEHPVWSHFYHFYVECLDWRRDGLISGRLEAFPHIGRGRDFDHRFTYDPISRRIVWAR